MSQPTSHPPVRMLVVDEDARICAVLTRALEAMGYCVQAAISAERALAMLETQSFDVMVLDPCMAGMNEAEAMYQVRRKHPDAIIIALTREASVESAIAAVKCGANDYLVKPDSLHQVADSVAQALQQRMGQIRRQAALRTIGEMLVMLRESDPPPARNRLLEAKVPYIYHRAPVHLDCQRQLVVVEGDPYREHRLTQGEATILRALMTHAGETLPCRYLAAMLSEGRVDEERASGAVRRYIACLRRKIEPDPTSPHVIRTVRGEGYLFEAD